MVPQDGNIVYPTLGPAVCDFIESYLVFGPGDLRGEPAVLDAEKRALIYRMYEVYPQDHASAGRRRFRRCALSLRKGSAKTELAAWLAACELHPEAPVRCVGWDENGNPIGSGVTDPFIVMVAYTEEQSDELAFAALRVTLAEGPLADDFDIGLERIIRRDGSGRAVSVATAPDARDGARTTFQVFDESHRLTLPRQKKAHQVMLANLPKRKLSDAWALEVTTAPAPGEGSVAEATMDYARLVADGVQKDSRLFFFHRQASEKHDISTAEGLRKAIVEASGPVAEWSDIDGILEQFADPTSDRTYLERVWLNRLVRSSERAFDAEAWKLLADPREIEPGRLITLGFDGARTRDSTALVGCDVEDGHLFLLGLWERPQNAPEGWTVDTEDVDAALAEAFERFEVWRMYADPPFWDTWVAAWAGRYGDKTVLNWWTNRQKPMAYALRAFNNAISESELSHDGSPDLSRHLGNSCRKPLRIRDEDDNPLWNIQKERPDSPHKIDAAMAAVLAWEARSDAVTAGATAITESVYNANPRFITI